VDFDLDFDLDVIGHLLVRPTMPFPARRRQIQRRAFSPETVAARRRGGACWARMNRAPLFRTIVDHVAQQITKGALRPRARVPSVRRLGARFEVSTNTVLHAFAELEALGLVEARPRSGYFVRPRASERLDAPSVPASRRPAVPRADRLPGFIRSMRDTSMIPLAAASLGSELVPAARLQRLLGVAARKGGPRGLRLDPLPGYAPLRREIARRMAQLGCAVTAEDVVITIGAIEAIFLALRTVTRQGDAVVVESPCYFGILQLLAELGLRAIEVPSDPGCGPPVERIAEALSREDARACVLVPSFSNPLGSLMPVAAKRALVELCTARETPIIESDVYGDLPFDGERPLPLKAFDRAGIVLHGSSFSKTLAPSFRVGWIAPGRFFDAVEQRKFTYTVASPTVTQAAIAELLASGGYDRHLRAVRQRLRDQVMHAREAIARCFPRGTRVSNPRGGFLIWVELPRGSVDAVELQRRALREKISIVPGPLFSAGDGFRRCFRVSCGHPWSPAIEAALARLARLSRP
jgi:DNA-binding transcriptional MocR family regulator